MVENYERYNTSNSELCRCLESANDVAVQVAENGGDWPFIGKISGLLPLSDPISFPFGEQLRWSTLLALHHLNRYTNQPIRLNIEFNDTACDVQRGIAAFVEVISRNTVLGILGPGCAQPGLVLGRLVPYLDMPMISYGIESVVMSDRSQYPSFYRLGPTSATYGLSWIGVAQEFNWNSVIVLVGAQTEFNDVSVLFQQLAETAGVSLAMLRVVKADASLNLKSLYAEIRATRTRIILVVSYVDLARILLCSGLKEVRTP